MRTVVAKDAIRCSDGGGVYRALASELVKQPAGLTKLNRLKGASPWVWTWHHEDSPAIAMQRRIWWLATAGKFFERLVDFMTGVALPSIVLEFKLIAVEKGIIGAATLFGILIGATLLGGLPDTVGRKQMFIIDMVMFTLFLALVAWAPTFPWLVFFLFGIGVALGCDYPTAHLVISEI